MNRTTRRLSAAAFASVVLLGACSSDNSTDSAATTTAKPASSTAAPSGTEAPATADIVDTAIAAGDFTTLVAAVQAAGLEDTLRGEGPFTVFAPTDAAFEKLPAGTVDSLLADPAALADILTYHVVAGDVMAADVVELDGQTVTTVNGATFTVNVGSDGSVTITDGAGNTATVVTTDIETSNGVIHVIDSVLLPS